ncbi:uncharacterized protein [Clytia hemisphaerica]|uniref:Uncharacterized protein n=1 Tax=Clytia hemisphaerica TaxID=252671 RepID=A0A7M5X2X7_9CNID
MERGKNISLSCSEPDLAFVGTHHWNEQNKQFRWGPFFSPFPMMQLPGSVRWDTITVYPYKDEDDSTVKAIAKDDKICEGNNNLLCQGETIDKKIFITICKKAELKGYCEEIPVLKSEITGNNKEKQVPLTVINGDGKYFQLNQEKKLKNQQVAIGTQDSPDPTSMTHTHLYDSYYDVDNSVWQPLIKDGKAYNLLQSMKVPDDILVELYTKGASGKRDRKFGAYEGPLTVDRIDGNDVMSNLIHFIVIKYSPKKIAAEDTTAGGDQADVDPKAENHTMPNDAEPLVSLPEGPDNGDSTTDQNTLSNPEP